jgi:hypothetical protein
VTVYVDELRDWSGGREVARFFAGGSCHLTTDGDVAELHAFAQKIGLRRAWFQGDSIPHYDLSPLRRAQAISNGAVVMPAREQARQRIAARKAAR